MTQILLCFTLSILIILGIIEFSEFFIKWSYLPVTNFDKERVFLIPLRGHQENIEYIIRSIAFTYNTQFSNCKFRIVCIDLGSDSETKKICSILSRDYNFIYIL